MNLKKPLFSVVIPLYNKEDQIEDTVNSVLDQTFDSFEVIVVDDGSTDDSLKVIECFTDPRIRIFSKENGGVSDARNYGIERAQGKYIALLDADDEWKPNFLEEMKVLIQKYPSCGLYTSAFIRLKPNERIVYGTSLPEGIIDDFFKVKMLHMIPWTSAVVVEKQVFDDVGGFPIGMIGGEDEYTWAKIALKYKIALTPKALALYNEVSTSFSFRMGKMDYCKESWFDLFEEGNFYRNEFVARKAIFAGIRYAYNPLQNKSSEIERLTRFTTLSKKQWWGLYLLNRMPNKGIVLIKILLPRYKRVKQAITKFKKNAISLFH